MLIFAAPLIMTLLHQGPVAPQLQGAKKLIAGMGGGSAAPSPSASSGRLADELQKFGETCERLSPEEAAKQWFALLEKSEASMATARSQKTNPSNMVRFLPPPSSWPALRRVIEEKTVGSNDFRIFRLRVFAQLLNHDLKSAESTLEARLQVADENPSAPGSYDEIFRTYFDLLLVSPEPDAPQRATKALLRAIDKRANLNMSWDDLPETLGEPNATKVFRELILNHPQGLDRISNPTCRRIIHRLALELQAQMKEPIWSFTADLDSTDLFQIFTKRFPYQPPDGEPSQHQQSRSAGRVAFALSLELEGKHARAVAQADNPDWFPDSPVETLFNDANERPDFSDAFFRLMAGVAQKHPEKIPWSATLNAAQTSGHYNQALDLLKREITRSKAVVQNQGLELGGLLLQGFLSAGRIDDAVAELRRELLAVKSSRSPEGDGSSQLTQLITIGRLCGRPDLVNEGVDRLLQIKGEQIGGHEGERRGSTDLEAILINQGKAARLEAGYVEAIRTSLKDYAERKDRPMGNFSGLNMSRRVTPYYSGELLSLVDLYSQINRPEDVLSVFQNSPGWGVDDLAGLVQWDLPVQYWSPTPVLTAAQALFKTANPKLAGELVQPLILAGTDEAGYYRVLLDSKGLDAVPVLDEAYRRNPYNAKPLVWKAEELHRAHRDKEAEEAVRKAIALDPSDANTMSGRWQLAYSVLEEILAAQGDSRELDEIKKKVHAASLVDHGDELLDSGFQTQAIPICEAAEKEWPGSASIECKLGLQADFWGKSELAKRHYAEGFALLPDQLGSSGGVKFDLDVLLSSSVARGVAKEQFTKALKAHPRHATTMYLLGRLAEVRGDKREAIKMFVEATEADPDCIAAWAMLSGYELRDQIQPAIADRAMTNLLRLDPDQKTFRLSVRSSADPSSIWEAFYLAPVRAQRLPTKLWRLDASAKALAKAGSDADEDEALQRDEPEDPQDHRLKAADAVAQIGAIQEVVQWFDYPAGDR